VGGDSRGQCSNGCQYHDHIVACQSASHLLLFSPFIMAHCCAGW
jgi:hypothetical protein